MVCCSRNPLRERISWITPVDSVQGIPARGYRSCRQEELCGDYIPYKKQPCLMLIVIDRFWFPDLLFSLCVRGQNQLHDFPDASNRVREHRGLHMAWSSVTVILLRSFFSDPHNARPRKRKTGKKARVQHQQNLSCILNRWIRTRFLKNTLNSAV